MFLSKKPQSNDNTIYDDTYEVIYEESNIVDTKNDIVIENKDIINKDNDVITDQTIDTSTFLALCKTSDKTKILDGIFHLTDDFNPGYMEDDNNSFTYLYKLDIDLACKFLDLYGCRSFYKGVDDNFKDILWDICNMDIDAPIMTNLILKMISIYTKNNDIQIDITDNFIQLCFHNKEDIAISLVKTNYVNNNICIERYNKTFLEYACMLSMIDLAFTLIEIYGLECQPNHIGSDSHTAFTYACLYGTDDLVLEMLKIYDDVCLPPYIGADALNISLKWLSEYKGDIYKKTKLFFKFLKQW